MRALRRYIEELRQLRHLVSLLGELNVLILKKLMDITDKLGIKPDREDVEELLKLFEEAKRIRQELKFLGVPTPFTNTRSTTRDSTEPAEEISPGISLARLGL